MINKYGYKKIILFIYVIFFNYKISEEYLIQDIFFIEKIHNLIKKNKNYFKYNYKILKKNKTLYINTFKLFVSLKDKNITTNENITIDENVTTDDNITTNFLSNKTKLNKKQKKIFKKYKNYLNLIPSRKNEYNIDDALENIKLLAIHKFIESIDIYLSFNSKRSKMTKNDNIKTFITFPHNLKKKRERKVYVITNRNMFNKAKESGADIVGEDDIINKIKEREIKLKKNNNTFLICTNDIMHKLTRIGKEIGRKGLMPNEKCGTLINEILLQKHINLFKFQNTYIFKLNKLNTLNINVGDVHMNNDEIKENILYLFDYLDNLEFFHFNSKNLKTIYLSSTMGFPFKIKQNFF